jgi:ubiquitin-like domain-containing CTD phosphatase 1
MLSPSEMQGDTAPLVVPCKRKDHAEDAPNGEKDGATSSTLGSADTSSATAAVVTPGMLTAKVTWRGKHIPLYLQHPHTLCIADVKRKLELETAVPMARQKLLGLVPGRLPGDTTLLRDILPVLQLQHPTQPHDMHIAFMMMGTPDAELLRDKLHDEEMGVVDDFEWDDHADSKTTIKTPQELAWEAEELVRDLHQVDLLKARMDSAPLHIMNAPRPGRNLLVLDLDYTLFDCKSKHATHFTQLIRPGTHEFLAAVYTHYDLVIWSQTSWRWLEAKITEMGLLDGLDIRSYQLCCVVDKTWMPQVRRIRRSGEQARKQHVKPLQVLWHAFGGRFHPGNTVHVDDLARNFVLNLQSGLRISAYKNGPATWAHDRELLPLTRYLLDIAEHVPDFRVLDHKVAFRLGLGSVQLCSPM